MGAQEQRAKAAKMAADLKARGFWHGKRQGPPGLSGIPVNRAGSAAYRRLQDRKRRSG